MRRSLALIAAVICWLPRMGLADTAVYAWDGSTHQPGLSPMVWVYCDTPTPEQSASKVADAFAHLQSRQRSILLANVFRRGHPFEAAHLKDIIRNGPATQPDVQYLHDLFHLLHDRQLDPARIILDFEDGLDAWVLSDVYHGKLDTILTPIYGDPLCLSKMPDDVKSFSVADYTDYHQPRGREAYIAWNQWQGQMRAHALAGGIRETPAEAFAKPIPLTNYGDIPPSFMVYDLTGCPIPAAAVGPESSPDLYITISHNRLKECRKDRRWNHFLDTLNIARSTIAHGLVPWVGTPRYSGDHEMRRGIRWLWAEQIRHLNAMGVSQFLYFNPKRPEESLAFDLEEDQFASRAFASLPMPDPVASRIKYHEILLDSDEVTTGSVTTTYADFLKHLDEPISK